MLTISPRRVASWMTLIAVALVLASLAGSFSTYVLGHPRLFGLVRLFNVNAEANLPSWYSSIALLVCSGLLALIARAKQQTSDRFTQSWRLLSAIFLVLSVDELASIHELLTLPLQGTLDTKGLLFYAWILPYGALSGLLGLGYLKFLAHLPTATRHLFILAAILYIGGAIGIEMIGGQHASLYGEKNLEYAIITALEELLEMLGIVVFIYGLLSYMKRYIKAFQISIRDHHLEPAPEMALRR